MNQPYYPAPMLAQGNGPFIEANQKIVMVGNRNGYESIRNMQPTVKSVFDTIDLATAGQNGAQMTFFQGCNARSFPDTNLSQNRLTAGNAFAVQRVVVAVVTKSGGVITNVQPVSNSAYPGLQLGTMTLIIASTEVISQQSLATHSSPFNSNSSFAAVGDVVAAGSTASKFYGQSVKTLDAQPIILPDQEFKVLLQLPQYTAPSAGTVFLQVILEGFGTLNAPAGTL